MFTKKSTATKTPAKALANKKTTPVAAEDKTRVVLKAHEVVLSSSCQNSVAISSWGKYVGEASMPDLIETLREQTKLVQDGDMRPVEAMLYGQAKTLETMFTALARRAASQDSIKWFQTHLSLALKAQAQCRSTLEALAEIKNPRPVQFVKQANMTTGPQQVNNYAEPGQAAAAASHGKNFQSEQNKLLESDHGQRMDIGAQGQAGRVNQTVEALG